MTLQLGDQAPDFTAETTEGVIHFHAWGESSWVVFFSHPKDFTPVCTTELGEAARLKGEFAKRNAKIIGISIDALDDHARWMSDIAETQGRTPNFPIIADPHRQVANLYGMVHPNADNTMTVRAVFIIDPKKTIRLMILYPASTGRNFAEILRVLDSVQLTDRHKVATPVNWTDGEDVIILPTVSDDEARERFPGGWTALKPYLRVLEQPPITFLDGIVDIPEGHYTLHTEDLWTLIELKREVAGFAPTDRNTLISRFGVAFTTTRGRYINYRTDVMTVSRDDILHMILILRERFEVHAGDELLTLCQPKTPSTATPDGQAKFPNPLAGLEVERPRTTGSINRLMARFFSARSTPSPDAS